MEYREFWEHIGKELKEAREAAAWTWADVERAGGPVAPTVRDNERGKVRTFKALETHAKALKVNFPDVVIRVVDLFSKKTTPDIWVIRLIKIYETSTVADRKRLRSAVLCAVEAEERVVELEALAKSRAGRRAGAVETKRRAAARRG